MQALEAPIDNLRWPAACCRCGSDKYRTRVHSDDVVIWTVISITSSRKISVAVPVCDPCWYRSIYWYAPAALIIGGTLALGDRIEHLRYSGIVFLVLLMGGIAMILTGLRQRPLRLLAFNPEQRLLKLGVYHPRTTASLLAAPGARPAEHKAVRRGYLYALGALMVLLILAGLWRGFA